MKVGRPSKLTPELMEKAKSYIKQYDEYDHTIPSAVGLANILEIHRSTLYAWAEDNEEFSDILENINQKQEIVLVSNGLRNEFNSNITKLVLGKHGYHDKSDVNTTMDVFIESKDAETL